MQVNLSCERFPSLFLVELGAAIKVASTDRALPHRHPTYAEMGFDGLKDLLAQIMLLQQVAEGQDRGLIRDAITSLISSMPAKRRIVGVSISASSIAGSLR